VNNQHADHNIRAAYLHVLADELRSLSVILGLTVAMIYQRRSQDIVKMVILTSADIRRGSKQLTFGDHLNPIFRLFQIWDRKL